MSRLPHRAIHRLLVVVVSIILLQGAACDDDDGGLGSPAIPDPIEGTIQGTVTVDGVGLSGIIVTRSPSTAGTRTTSASGAYEFLLVREGSYTISISGFPISEVTFPFTATNATIVTAFQVVIVNFEGTSTSLSGVYQGQLTVESDATPPHDPFVFDAGVGKNAAVTLTINGGVVTLESQTGFDPTSLPSGLNGAIAADGTFSMSALASIFLQIDGNQFEIVDVSFDIDGTLANGVLTLTITVGANGSLPKPDGTLGADPVVYMFSGTVE